MRQLVVRDLKIFDEEKYNNLPIEDKPIIGTIIETSGLYPRQSFWWGEEKENIPCSIFVVDETDENCQKIPRNFRLEYDNQDGECCYENFDIEENANQRIKDLFDAKITKRVDWHIINK